MQEIAKIGVVPFFSNRFSQYSLLMSIFKDVELTCTLIAYLDVGDILSFTSISSQFYQLRKIQSIQVRILRAKIKFYQDPKPSSIFDPCFFMLSHVNKLEHEVKEPSSIKKQHDLLVKLVTLKRKQKQIKNNSLSIQDKLNLQLRQLTMKAQIKQMEINQPDLPVQKFKQINIAANYNNKNVPVVFTNPKLNYKLHDLDQPIKKQTSLPKQPKEVRIKEANIYSKKLEETEYRLAQRDYEKRKMKKMMIKQTEELTIRQLREIAEEDPWKQRIFMKIYQQQKQKQQRENISKLMMRKYSVPSRSKVQQTSSQGEIQNISVVKPTIVNKLYSNIKNLFYG